MQSKLVTPHAAVLVWNYNDRVSADGGISPAIHDVEQVIIGTSSIMSISTSKRKSSPAGTFEIRLAPRFNWVGRLTPGSWCAILMSQEKIPAMEPSNVGSADFRNFKMLGRIDAVRGVVEVNQETGARSTTFIVTGQDWGSVFESKLYIDPILRNNNFENDAAVGQAARILAGNLFAGWSETKPLPTSSQIVDAIVNLWGAPLSDLTSGIADALSSVAGAPGAPNPTVTPGISFTSDAQFQLPKPVAQYMKQGSIFGALVGAPSVNFSKIIKKYHGTLSSYDQYSGDNQEALGIPDPASFFRMNTFWQMLTDNCNPVLNELVTDIRWEGNQPVFALYHRIKPFLNRENFQGSTEDPVSKNRSMFKNVRKVKIDLNDVVSMNFGTNWRDKINFIEITPQSQLVEQSQLADAKILGQTLDRAGYERDGFKPMFFYSMYMPYDTSKVPAIQQLLKWKFILREWHFNTHMMLNGAITFIGQSQYIQVGDNIMIDSKVLGSAALSSAQKTTAGKTFFLAHVENVSHEFTVNPENGARSYLTTVQFVRGIVAKEDGSIVTPGIGGSLLNAAAALASAVSGGGPSDPMPGAIDPKAGDLIGADERNSNVFGTSTPNDPDKQKLKGN